MRVANGVQLGAVLIAHVTLRGAKVPFRTGGLGADIRVLLDCHVVPDAGHLALGGGRVAHAAD